LPLATTGTFATAGPGALTATCSATGTLAATCSTTGTLTATRSTTGTLAATRSTTGTRSAAGSTARPLTPARPLSSTALTAGLPFLACGRNWTGVSLLPAVLSVGSAAGNEHNRVDCEDDDQSFNLQDPSDGRVPCAFSGVASCAVQRFR
jgi:hypothetical protein